MALIKCSECGKEISDKAQMCPYCGCPKEYQVPETHVTNSCDIKQTTTPAWDKVVYLIVEERAKIEAVKEIILLTGVSLADAKHIADYIEANHVLPPDVPAIKTDEPQSKTTTCTSCSKEISVQAEVCPRCGQPTGVHVCPKCGSTNTKTISGVSKAASIFLWGPFAANKVVSKFQCKSCGHKW